MTKTAKYKVGDLVSFNAPEAFGGAHFKSRNDYYNYPGVVIGVVPKYFSAKDKGGESPRNFAYSVAWANNTRTDEHECYLIFPHELEQNSN